ncbi:hypothetical protein BS78_09G060300 [Paspalum vaginatum]|nr:hypothetical protein BS78_09G060300 [Paspalum vaginatum]
MRCGNLVEYKAVQCRQMSNYMMYLLFVNPEMLLPGTRWTLLTYSYNEFQGILKSSLFKATYEELRDKKKHSPLCCCQSSHEEEERLMGRVIAATLNKLKNPSQESNGQGPEEESKEGLLKEKFIDAAWTLAQKLLGLGDEKMWQVIEGVWVEMLCFSASRCRGYLHAKALGSGGEFLSYIWLLLFYMGTETLTERLQREELIPSPPRREEGLAVVLPSWQGNNTISAPSTSSTHAASSTSEIHAAGEDMV